jgi:hypothetical protein
MSNKIFLSIVLTLVVLSPLVFSLSAATTSVTIITPPEITNLTIFTADNISCSWKITDFGDQYFSDLIWMKDGEVFSEEQFTCLDCESTVPYSSGEWTCMLTVRDSNNIETSLSAFTVVDQTSNSGPTGFVTVDVNAFTELITQFVDMLSKTPELFTMIGDFFF